MILAVFLTGCVLGGNPFPRGDGYYLYWLEKQERQILRLRQAIATCREKTACDHWLRKYSRLRAAQLHALRRVHPHVGPAIKEIIDDLLRQLDRPLHNIHGL
ncbi:hypothetical protein KKF84_09205 [Myxococcota bacterium]|nr:hypothetical protein [Myxococcota bacterium]